MRKSNNLVKTYKELSIYKHVLQTLKFIFNKVIVMTLVLFVLEFVFFSLLLKEEYIKQVVDSEKLKNLYFHSIIYLIYTSSNDSRITCAV